ncbi:AraC family transcriptional regulator [Flavobacterium turcicum]|uniref:Helix-turn-helix domain-containing protein n=1 Tax=Flavobacterium turcicum TaxID=2764718 RepID=A0ABR7JIJ2_9FLAO|nr:helix-turn-helix domain-containing protein [Flavobacterium turcicum]MBC5864316.1 helix-turn-helix domain-containing protein [Flavobacterium turcicum]NHL02910.1 helix-turn-helix domain-containing protein [Flavobacterium turcicum]
MNKTYNEERIVTIHQMLFEMARGNFNTRIPLSSNDEELETIVVLINMVAEEMKESVFQIGYINTHKTFQVTARSTFVLDFSFLIKSFTPEVTSFLGHSESELINLSLADIITTVSFEQLQEVLDANSTLPITITLDFTPKEHLPISIASNIVRLVNRSEIIINLVTPARQDTYSPLLYGNENEKHNKTRKADALLIQKLYDYILAHLEEPLPSLKVLSSKFGTNEHKLKDGFRHFFKTSIYQFYNQERLKRAFFMIEHTGIPLKNISVMNGFNNYPNFSKSFKKQFGFSPNELKRNEVDFILVDED